jgi:hypothetical protein
MVGKQSPSILRCSFGVGRLLVALLLLLSSKSPPLHFSRLKGALNGIVSDCQSVTQHLLRPAAQVLAPSSPMAARDAVAARA